MSWVAKNVCHSTLHFFHSLHISLPGTLHQVEFVRSDKHSTNFQNINVKFVNDTIFIRILQGKTGSGICGTISRSICFSCLRPARGAARIKRARTVAEKAQTTRGGRCMFLIFVSMFTLHAPIEQSV